MLNAQIDAQRCLINLRPAESDVPTECGREEEAVTMIFETWEHGSFAPLASDNLYFPEILPPSLEDSTANGASTAEPLSYFAKTGGSARQDVIVVTADPPDPPPFESYWSYSDYVAAYDYTTEWGSAGVDVGEVAAYQTSGVSAEANAFADAHVHNNGTTVLDAHAYKLVHDAFAKFYEWAKANPNALINIGNGLTVSATQALHDFERVTYNIADVGGGSHGDATAVTYDNTYSIGLYSTSTLNPQLWLSFPTNKSLGDAGINYTVFHELGHSLNAFEYGRYNAGDEAAANTAGRSMEVYLGLELIPVTPEGGYD